MPSLLAVCGMQEYGDRWTRAEKYVRCQRQGTIAKLISIWGNTLSLATLAFAATTSTGLPWSPPVASIIPMPANTSAGATMTAACRARRGVPTRRNDVGLQKARRLVCVESLSPSVPIFLCCRVCRRRFALVISLTPRFERCASSRSISHKNREIRPAKGVRWGHTPIRAEGTSRRVRQARGQKDLRSGTRDEIGSPCGERGVSASSRSVHHGDSARDRQGGRVGT